MKASYLLSYGSGTGNMKYGELPDPVLKDNHLLVEVKAVSVNPLDYKIKSGLIRLITGPGSKKILGSDFAGIVKKTGPGVKGFAEGDRVYGNAPLFRGQNGALAQFLSVGSAHTRIMPEGMTFNDAACLPVAGLTALNGLRRCKVGNRTKLLVNGATGGVGHFAVQIAKARGASVTATCSNNNRDFALSLGADSVIGYSKEELRAPGIKYDAILDAYGKMDYTDIIRLLRRGGIYASTLFFGFIVIASIHLSILFGRKLLSANLRGLPEDFAELEKLYREEKLKPFIVKSFTLENAVEALEYAEKNRPTGKVIVLIT